MHIIRMWCDTVFCTLPCAHVTKSAEDHQVQNDGAYCCFVRPVVNYLSIWGTYIEYTVVCLYTHTVAIPGFSWHRKGSCCIFQFLIQSHTALLCSLTVLIISVANVNESHQGTLQPIPPSQAPHWTGATISVSTPDIDVCSFPLHPPEFLFSVCSWSSLGTLWTRWST